MSDFDWDAYNICPVCGKPAEMLSKCFCAERICANNHFWHWCSTHSKVVLGEVHSVRKDSYCLFECTCGENL